jgi:hypothetical protein
MTLQQEVAAYLRELADKVERSRYCAVLASEDKRMYMAVNTGQKWDEKFPTGERQVELKLNYIEENT